MRQSTAQIDKEWLKVLGKGMVTLPKKWRQELGIQEGDIVKAKKEGNTVIIEAQQTALAPYRVYSNDEIDEFLKEDELPEQLITKTRKHLSVVSS